MPTKPKSGPHTREDVTRTHQEEQGEEEDEVEDTPAVKPQSKAGVSYKPKPRPSPHHLLLVVRSVHAFPVHFFLVVMEKGPLAGIRVVSVMSLVRVVVCVVLGLFSCDGVVV